VFRGPPRVMSPPQSVRARRDTAERHEERSSSTNPPPLRGRGVAPRPKRVTRSTWVAPKTGRRSATPAQPARCRDRPLVLWTSRGLRAPPRSPLVPIGFLRKIGSLVGGEDPCRTHSASTCQGRTGSPAGFDQGPQPTHAHDADPPRSRHQDSAHPSHRSSEQTLRSQSGLPGTDRAPPGKIDHLECNVGIPDPFP
jgi:hypothetical protein